MHVASDEDWQIADSEADERFTKRREGRLADRRSERAIELKKLLKVHEARKAAGFDTKEKAAIDAERRKAELDRLLERHETETMLEEEADNCLRFKAMKIRDDGILRIQERFLQSRTLRQNSLNRVQIGILRGTNCQDIMSLLKKERQNVSIQVGGCTRLLQLTFNDMDQCENAGGRLFAASGLKQENGCDCIINAIKTHPSESILIVKALGVMGNLCLFQPNGKKLAAAGAMQTVLACIQEFPYNPVVLREICRAISQLCFSWNENTDEAAELGLMEHVMGILKRFGRHPVTGTQVCQAVLALIAENDEMLEQALDLGLLLWATESLEGESVEKEIYSRQLSAVLVRNALRLTTMVVSSGIVLDEEGLLTLLRCLQTHIADAYVQLYALQLLHAAMAPEHPQREDQIQNILAVQKSEEAVVSWVVTAMDLHIKVGNLQWQACAILLLLIQAEPKTQGAYRQARGLNVVADGLRKNTHLPPVLEQYCRLIAVTGTNVVDRSTYCNASLQCPQLIQKLLYVHRNHLGVQHFGNLALKVLHNK